MMCEVARQVKMSCGSFTHNLMIMSSDNPIAAELKIQQTSQELQMIAIAAGITGEVEVNPLQTVVDALQVQLEASVNSAEVDRLQATIDTLNATIADQTTTIADQLATIELNEDQIATLNNVITELNEANNAKATEILSLKSDVEAAQTKVNELAAERDALTTKNADLQSQINAAVKERDDLQTQLTASLNKETDLSIQIDNRDVQISELNDTITELKAQHIEDLKAEFKAGFKDGYADAETKYIAKLTRTGTAEDGTPFSTFHETAQDAYDQGYINGQHSKLKEINSLNHQIVQLTNTKMALKGTISTLTTEKESLQKAHDILFDSITAEETGYQAQIAAANNQIGNLTNKIEKVEKAHEEALEAIKVVQSAYEGLEDHFTAAYDNDGELDLKNSGKGFQVIFVMGADSIDPEDGITQADLDAANGEIEDLHFEVDEAYEEIEDLLNEISNMKSAHAEALVEEYTKGKTWFGDRLNQAIVQAGGEAQEWNLDNASLNNDIYNTMLSIINANGSDTFHDGVDGTIADFENAMQIAGFVDYEFYTPFTGVNSLGFLNGINEAKEAGKLAGIQQVANQINDKADADIITVDADGSYSINVALLNSGGSELIYAVEGDVQALTADIMSYVWDVGPENYLEGDHDPDAAFDNHDAISVQAGNVEMHGQNGEDGYYIAPHPDAPTLNAIFTDVVVGDTTYTYYVSTEANYDINEVYEVGNFANTILRDIVADVAEISYKSGYEDGYNDGYADGFRDGVASVTLQ